MDSPTRRSLLIGSLAGLAVFAALEAARAFGQPALDIGTIAENPTKFYEQRLSVSGVVKSIYHGFKYVGHDKVPTLSFNLYEPVEGASSAKRFVRVQIPEQNFTRMPQDGQMMTVTGQLRPPAQVGSIED